MAFEYFPQAYPSQRFSTIKECRGFMNSGKVPWHNFHTHIGCFIVRFDKRNGTYALFEHRFQWQKDNYKIYVQRYKKTPADRNNVTNV